MLRRTRGARQLLRRGGCGELQTRRRVRHGQQDHARLRRHGWNGWGGFASRRQRSRRGSSLAHRRAVHHVTTWRWRVSPLLSSSPSPALHALLVDSLPAGARPVRRARAGARWRAVSSRSAPQGRRAAARAADAGRAPRIEKYKMAAHQLRAAARRRRASEACAAAAFHGVRGTACSAQRHETATLAVTHAPRAQGPYHVVTSVKRPEVMPRRVVPWHDCPRRQLTILLFGAARRARAAACGVDADLRLPEPLRPGQDARRKWSTRCPVAGARQARGQALTRSVPCSLRRAQARSPGRTQVDELTYTSCGTR